MEDKVELEGVKVLLVGGADLPRKALEPVVGEERPDRRIVRQVEHVPPEGLDPVGPSWQRGGGGRDTTGEAQRSSGDPGAGGSGSGSGDRSARYATATPKKKTVKRPHGRAKKCRAVNRVELRGGCEAWTGCESAVCERDADMSSSADMGRRVGTSRSYPCNPPSGHQRRRS